MGRSIRPGKGAGCVSRLVCLLALTAAVGAPAPAAKIVVGGACSLLDAITAANDNTPTGGCNAGSATGADTIHLTEDYTAGGDSIIDSEVILKGHGRRLLIFLRVQAPGNLTLHRVRDLWGVRAQDPGASVRIERSEVRGTVRNEGETTISDSLIENHFGRGIDAIDGTVRILDSSVVNSGMSVPVLDNGGGISIGLDATVLIENSTIAGNRAGGGAPRGGGIYNLGDLTILASSLIDNLAEGTASAFGGAIANRGSLIIWNGTLSGNAATAPGGPLNAAAGGGILSETLLASTRIKSSTFHGNRATGGGTVGAGGIQSDGLGLFELKNTIVTASTGVNCQATLTDLGGNFGCPGGLGDVTNIDPTLRDNGGPTLTHALLAGSNAIDVGGKCDIRSDQRGVKRLGNCDSGAFELGGCPDDVYELEASSIGSDDSCPGAEVRYTADKQSHRLCDHDWVHFTARTGSEYVVETSGLSGGADTVIQAYRPCGTFLDGDDDSGPGLGSSLYLLPGGGTVAVQVKDCSLGKDPCVGGYGPAKGYDLTVTCVFLCPCPADDGKTLELTSGIVSGAEVYEVCDTLEAGDYTVGPTGTLILGAGNAVILHNDFAVQAGGTLQIENDPALWPL